MYKSCLNRFWYYPAMKTYLTIATLLIAFGAADMAQASEQAGTPDAIDIPESAQFPEPVKTPGSLTQQDKDLILSAYNGQLASVEVLVKKGANVNLQDQKKRTPLIFAASNGHTPVVEYLVGAGADVNAKDGGGQTALSYASKRSFNETAAFLLENGAEVNVRGTKKGITPLMLAAGWGNKELVQMLLEHGADPNITNIFGKTAKMLAKDRGNSDVVDLLPDPPAPESEQ